MRVVVYLTAPLIGPIRKNQDINEVTNKLILSVNYVLSLFIHVHASVKNTVYLKHIVCLVYGSVIL